MHIELMISRLEKKNFDLEKKMSQHTDNTAKKRRKKESYTKPKAKHPVWFNYPEGPLTPNFLLDNTINPMFERIHKKKKRLSFSSQFKYLLCLYLWKMHEEQALVS